MPSVTHGAAAAEGWLALIQDSIATFVCDLDVEKAIVRLGQAAAKYTGK